MNKTMYVTNSSLTTNASGETLSFTLAMNDPNPNSPNNMAMSGTTYTDSIANPTAADKALFVFGAKIVLSLAAANA